MKLHGASRYPPLLIVLAVVVAFLASTVFTPSASQEGHKLSVSFGSWSPPSERVTVSVTQTGKLDIIYALHDPAYVVGLRHAAVANDGQIASDAALNRESAWARLSLDKGFGLYAPERRNWRMRT